MSAPEDEATASRLSPRRRFWLRIFLTVALVALLVAEGFFLWPRLGKSVSALGNIEWLWLAACIAAQAVSMSGFARLQKQLLHVGGVEVRQRSSLAVIYSATAMSVTLPAGQVFSAAFTYRAMRRWGASPLVASWQLAMSAVIATAGLALIGLAGASHVGTDRSPLSLLVPIAAVALVAYFIKYASTHPDAIRSVALRGLALVNRVRRRAREAGKARVQQTIDQLDAVKIGKLDAVLALLWSGLHRLGDIGCLLFACWAVGSDPKLAGILIAFSIGKAVGSIPLAPGGLGFVDTALVAALTSAASISAAHAVAAALVYRLVSLVLVAATGWTVVAFRFRNYKTDSDFDKAAETA